MLKKINNLITLFISQNSRPRYKVKVIRNDGLFCFSPFHNPLVGFISSHSVRRDEFNSRPRYKIKVIRNDGLIC